MSWISSNSTPGPMDVGWEKLNINPTPGPQDLSFCCDRYLASCQCSAEASMFNSLHWPRVHVLPAPSEIRPNGRPLGKQTEDLMERYLRDYRRI
ncbi:hypothetical protein AOLI_G00123820 [Acnodon oligacanthus]